MILEGLSECQSIGCSPILSDQFSSCRFYLFGKGQVPGSAMASDGVPVKRAHPACARHCSWRCSQDAAMRQPCGTPKELLMRSVFLPLASVAELIVKKITPGKKGGHHKRGTSTIVFEG